MGVVPTDFETEAVPFWVKVSCALAISLGTYVGGWRIIRTLGKGLVEIRSPQGMAAESSSAAVILASSHLGFALSTTQVTTGCRATAKNPAITIQVNTCRACEASSSTSRVASTRPMTTSVQRATVRLSTVVTPRDYPAV